MIGGKLNTVLFNSSVLIFSVRMKNSASTCCEKGKQDFYNYTTLDFWIYNDLEKKLDEYGNPEYDDEYDYVYDYESDIEDLSTLGLWKPRYEHNIQSRSYLTQKFIIENINSKVFPLATRQHSSCNSKDQESYFNKYCMHILIKTKSEQVQGFRDIECQGLTI